MASLAAPSTPKHRPLERAILQRSFTVPANIDPANRHAQSTSSAGIQTLFIHQSARVVSFTTSLQSATSTPSSSPGLATQEYGDISWQHANERTIAAGHLEIYRIPGSVSFLHSGTLLHAILPRSQCWCVDGASKFVFRVLPETYYRIELPYDTEEDKVKVEGLIAVLKTVLCYEKTSCPFKRGFHVEVSPVLKNRQLQHRTSERSLEPAKRWKLDGIWRPEDQVWARRLELKTGRSYSRQDDREESSEQMTSGHPSPCAQPEQASSDRRPSHLAHLRSVTAPPAWNTRLQRASGLALDGDGDATDSGDRHGLPAQNSDRPQIELVLDEPKATHGKESDPWALTYGALSDTTSVPQSGRQSAVTPQYTPPLSIDGDTDSDFWGHSTSNASQVHSRRLRKGGRVKFPQTKLNALETPRQTQEQSISRLSPESLTDNVVIKGCAIFLGPPAHLVSLMLRIAANLASGALNMTIRTPSGAHRRVPGSWELSDDEGQNHDDWDIDDYGFPLSVERA